MLEKYIIELPRVGKQRVKSLNALGLYNVGDVLFSYPRAYKDYTKVLSPDNGCLALTGLFYGRLTNLSEKIVANNKRVIHGKICGNIKSLTVSWFTSMKGRGTSYLYRKLSKNQFLWVYGTIKNGFWGLEIANPEWHSRKPSLSLIPIYPLVSGITNNMRVNWVKYALNYLTEVYECLPAYLLQEYMGRQEALTAIHFPENTQYLDAAIERLKFEEVFLFHINLSRKKYMANNKTIKHKPDGLLVKTHLKNLSFELTKGQKKALNDVCRDMESSNQMRRLIQGDVGSGKTVIAEYAAVKAYESDGQVAIMVPTEVLANQMWERFNQALSPLEIEVGLLISNMKSAEQKNTLEKLKNNKLKIVIGTHALITERVKFANLRLAIIDEQHRFGVEQRNSLSKKGGPDILVMSATPIPRSLALTLYGDLENTIISELPRGRKKVDTRLIHPSKRNDVYDFVVKRVRNGEQAFVVFPLIDESEKLTVKAATKEIDYLSKGPLKCVRIALVHGQMGKEKDKLMDKFLKGTLDVLVATTIVEVGMNIPNATVMVIEDADRFGLAQLHQLRGRVGRSNKQGYCFLISDPKSIKAKKRLGVLRTTNNGLVLAEEDLKIRGFGDLLGIRQSGQPLFKLADIIRDQNILEKAAKHSSEILQKDPKLHSFPTLLEELKRQR